MKPKRGRVRNDLIFENVPARRSAGALAGSSVPPQCGSTQPTFGESEVLMSEILLKKKSS
jgi:hypothetical protein